MVTDDTASRMAHTIASTVPTITAVLLVELVGKAIGIVGEAVEVGGSASCISQNGPLYSGRHVHI